MSGTETVIGFASSVFGFVEQGCEVRVKPADEGMGLCEVSIWRGSLCLGRGRCVTVTGAMASAVAVVDAADKRFCDAILEA